MISSPIPEFQPVTTYIPEYSKSTYQHAVLWNFGWNLDDFVSGSIDFSNCTLLRRHHKLVDSCDWHTVQFLSEIINVRDDVFSLDFSDGFTLYRS